MDETFTRDPVDKSAGVVPQMKFMKFVEKMIDKSKRLIDDQNGGYYAVTEMNAAAICHTFALTNVFVCLEHSMSKYLVAYEDLSDFPIFAFFMRDCPEFD